MHIGWILFIIAVVLFVIAWIYSYYTPPSSFILFLYVMFVLPIYFFIEWIRMKREKK